MPELPEAETVRRSLDRLLVNRRIIDVVIRRPDMICRISDGHIRSRPRRRSEALQHELLTGSTVASTTRHGKQVALVADDGRVICLAFGMTGQIWCRESGMTLPVSDHFHVEWVVEGGSPAGTVRILFRDTRRFGAVFPFRSLDELQARKWSLFGPDALSISRRELVENLARTAQPIKAALLNQHLIAGIGNIYADESLFMSRINPRRAANDLTQDELVRLHRAIRRVLRAAIEAGGTTLRDFVDGQGHPGGFRPRLRAYGRADVPCTRCGTPMVGTRIVQRQTTYCPVCQPATNAL